MLAAMHPMITRARVIATAGILGALTVALYAHTVEYPFVRWDDGLLIYDNPAIRTVSSHTLKTIFTTYDPELYIPITLLSYQLDFLMGGIDPAVYHLQNILWHLLNGILMTTLLSALLHKRSGTEDAWPAGFALLLGCLFVVHPMHVETVVWASARKDLLSTFFALSTMITMLQWIDRRRRSWYYASLVLFAMGLMSKVTILLLPIALFALDLWMKRQIDRDAITEKIPFALLSIVFGVIGIFGKASQLTTFGLGETVLVVIKSIMFTLLKWFWPIGLSVLYPFNEAVDIASGAFLAPISGTVLLAVAIAAIAKRRRSLTPLLCTALFLLALLPSLLNFAKGGTIYLTSDRYAYFASMGMLLGIGTIANAYAPYRRVFAGLLIGIVTACMILAYRQTTTLSGSEALFRNVLAYYPDAYVAHNNLANFVSERARAEGNIAAALENYTQALKINERLAPSAARDAGRSKILSNMASALRQSGDLASAELRYREAMRWSPTNPYAIMGLGILSASKGDALQAERMYRIVLQSAPRFSPGYLNLGSLYAAQGKSEDALRAFDQALAIDPFLPQAHFNRGVVLQKLGQLAQARIAYMNSIDLAPSFVAARINLGILEGNSGKTAAAIEQFEAVLRLDPDNIRAKQALKQLQSN